MLCLQGDLAVLRCPPLSEGYLPVLRRILVVAPQLSLQVHINTAAETSSGMLEVSLAVQQGGAAASPGAEFVISSLCSALRDMK